MKRFSFLAALASLLTGCATTAALKPGFYKGEPQVARQFPIQVAYTLDIGKDAVPDPCKPDAKRWIDFSAAKPLVEQAIKKLYAKARPANLGDLNGEPTQPEPEDQLLLWIAFGSVGDVANAVVLSGTSRPGYVLKAVDPEFNPVLPNDPVTYYKDFLVSKQSGKLHWPTAACPLSTGKLNRILAANLPKLIDQLVAALADPAGISRYPENKAGARWEMSEANRAAAKGEAEKAFAHAMKAVVLPPEGSNLDKEIRPQFLKVAAKAKSLPVLPAAAEEHMLRARELSRLEKFAPAEDEYRKAIALAPWWGQAYYNRAVSAEARAKKIMPLPMDLKPGQIGFTPAEYTEALAMARRMYEYYVLVSPGAADREQVRTRILQLSF